MGRGRWVQRDAHRPDPWPLPRPHDDQPLHPLEPGNYEGYHLGAGRFRAGDGYQGWPDEAPFDAIILTAAPAHIQQPLLDQLAIGGRLILPLRKTVQKLMLIRRTQEGWRKEELLPVAFVPMTGEAESAPLPE